MKKIFCFGDSITRGSWDSEGGWVARLRRELDGLSIEKKEPKYFQNMFNLGISGCPVEDIIARFDNETKARTSEDNQNIFVFMVGMINSGRYADTGENTTGDSQWLEYLDELVSKARSFDGKIMFIGIPPVDESRVNSSNRVERLGRTYTNKRVSEIDALTTKFCKEKGIVKVEINQEMLALEDYASMCFDGIHPNDDGHEWIYQKVRGPFFKLIGL